MLRAHHILFLVLLVLQYFYVQHIGYKLSEETGQIRIWQSLLDLFDKADSYRVPAQLETIYTYDDFMRQFGVREVHEYEYEPHVLEYLDKHNVKQDPSYLEDPETIDALTEKYAQYLSRSHRDEDMEKLYVKWTNPTLGYGLYAKTRISKDEPIGVFYGIITDKQDETSHMWEYESIGPSGEKEFGIDALKTGNYLRFINHDLKRLNVDTIRVPYNNRWYIIYVAIRDISPDEELFLNYGEAYTQSRGWD
ncbi:hypothetical protein EDD86DRAFT_256877 [Gorgonomyces haynaldii]|nr:hypothetical protein EDD86DRAFT_256877 [Gorgonomyces haynaldii]